MSIRLLVHTTQTIFTISLNSMVYHAEMPFKTYKRAVLKYVFKVHGADISESLLGAAIASMLGFVAAALLSRMSDGPWDDLVALTGLVVTAYFSIRSLLKLVESERKSRKEYADAARKLAHSNRELVSENERLKKRDAEKTEVLSFATHQMRGPLAVIAGNASLLHDMSAVTYDPVRPITDSARSLSEIVDDFLSFAAIEHGALECEMSEFDMSVLVHDVVSECMIAARRKSLLLVHRVDSRFGYRLRGDSRKIAHAVKNLLENAIKYTDAGSVHVHLSRRGGGVQLVVSDTGSGFAPGTEESLFEKFRRGADGRIRSNGSGVGLYLVRRIAEAHGGKAWARSRGLGVGSDFFLALPSHYGRGDTYI